ncbi:MAG: PDZ domain-containing protein [Firmicutes bacterium]|nr:PDZ domain-containing protein [Bacillota bacterium]
MQDFYQDYTDTPKRPSFFWRGMIAGAVVMGLLLLLFFSQYGKAWWPAGEDSERQPPLPWEENNGPRNTAPGDDEQLNISPEARDYYLAVARAAERVTPSVVGIGNYGLVYDLWGRSQLQERATGSGVIISSEGYIVTNYHVIENARELSVSFGSGEELPAEVVGADPPTDLAVIKVDKKGLPAAEFADSDNLKVGEPAIAIGNPLGIAFQQSVTKGVVSARERSITIQGQKFTFIQTDAAINDGNSGGALVNINGRVIGINTAKIKISGVEGMGFAIPSNTVRQITAELVKKGRVERPWLGVTIKTLTPLEAQRLQINVDYGVLVDEVVAGSPAFQAGIRPLDVIVALEGKKTSDSAALQNALYQFKIGQKIKVTVFRENKEFDLELTLEKMPGNLGE